MPCSCARGLLAVSALKAAGTRHANGGGIDLSQAQSAGTASASAIVTCTCAAGHRTLAPKRREHSDSCVWESELMLMKNSALAVKASRECQ